MHSLMRWINIINVRHNSLFFLRLPFQILGAFADPSGVPMQGMKIKNVVPGKTRSFFRPVFVFCFFVFGTFDRLHVPRHSALRIRDSRYFSCVILLVAFCGVCVCGLKPFSKAGWDLFPSSVIMLKTRGTITALLRCWRGDAHVSDTQSARATLLYCSQGTLNKSDCSE